MRHPLLASLMLLISPLALAEDKAVPKPEAPAESPELKKGRERLEECRKLFREGKENEAIKLASESMDIFVAPYPQLQWIDVGAIETDKYRVVIHVNTTEDERAKVKKFIVRPYTFCVFPKEPGAELLYVIDFEQGYDEGVLKSAALGRNADSTHFNLGMLDTNSSFTAVRDVALKMIKADTINPTEKK